jgi:hypothetical protein
MTAVAGLAYHEPTLHSFAALPGTSLLCTEQGVGPLRSVCRGEVDPLEHYDSLSGPRAWVALASWTCPPPPVGHDPTEVVVIAQTTALDVGEEASVAVEAGLAQVGDQSDVSAFGERNHRALGVRGAALDRRARSLPPGRRCRSWAPRRSRRQRSGRRCPRRPRRSLGPRCGGRRYRGLRFPATVGPRPRAGQLVQTIPSPLPSRSSKSWGGLPPWETKKRYAAAWSGPRGSLVPIGDVPLRRWRRALRRKARPVASVRGEPIGHQARRLAWILATWRVRGWPEPADPPARRGRPTPCRI